MQGHITSIRHSNRQRKWQLLHALVLALAAFLFFARPVPADGQANNSQSKDKKLLQKLERTYILGPVEVHLVFTDANGKEQEYSLAEAPPDFLKKLPPALQAQSKSLLLNPKVRLFDGLWVENSAAVCKEAVDYVMAMFPPGSDHEAYQAARYVKEPPLTELPAQLEAYAMKNVTEVIPGNFVPPSCTPFKVGFMSAWIYPRAAAYFPQYNSQGAEVIPVGGYPTNQVKQLQISFGPPPLNIVPFTLTTPCTCHQANLFCNKDPDFTLFFDVMFNVVVNSTELDSWKFGPKPQMKTEYYLGMRTEDGLAMRGGYEKQVADLEHKLETQLAVDVAALATDELSWVTVVAQFFYDLVKYGVGGLYELSCDSQIYQTVDASLSGEFSTSTVAKMANTASEAFKNLFAALDTANAAGFTKLDIELAQDQKKTLIFKLTYPPPAKPKLENSVAAANKGIHLSPASLGVGGQQVAPGVPFMVSGSNFMGTYTNDIELDWGVKTVAGPPINSVVQWGPKGGKMEDVPATGFRATNLKPGTAYQFRVHECDLISCAPWSDWLTTSTQASGSNDVTLWLDKNSAQPVGTGTAQPNGSFLLKVTVPPGTSPGTHTLNAATGTHTQGEQPLASVDITVAGASGPGPSISLVNSPTGPALPPPVDLLYPSTATIRGNHFAPGVIVTVHLDNPTGPKLGTATPDKLGTFVGKFQIPMTSGGGHQLVAVQAAGGTPLQATVAVVLLAQPK